MSNKKVTILIFTASLGLIALIAIQLNWMIKARDYKEDQIHRQITNMMWYLVSKTNHNVLYDQKYEMYTLRTKARSEEGVKEMIKQVNFDSLIVVAFHLNQLDIDYDYKIVKKDTPCQKIYSGISYCGYDIAMLFPNRDEYVMAKLSFMLIASLVVVVLGSVFLITIISTILKQKKIAEMTTEFINNMTHELKTPLATISLATKMIKKIKTNTSEDEKIQKYNHAIYEENQKLNEQIERMLQLSRLEEVDIKLNKEETDIHKLLKQAGRMLELQLNVVGGKIKYELKAESHILQTDKEHLKTVISNLLDNAKKYSLHKPEIFIKTFNEDHSFVLEIQDNGIGINKEAQKYIFDKFYRVSKGNIHDVKGFGLGLAYVKTIVNALKGQINLKSEVGFGSTFKISLPISTN